jgi:hypothetical protein
MFSARRDEVLRRYGIAPGTHPDYEIDHLIPLCLGGSDDPSNLWPQPRRSLEETWNAEAKDRLERLMCNMVCDGQIDIATAQQAFATDWIAAYQTYYDGEGKTAEAETGSLTLANGRAVHAHIPAASRRLGRSMRRTTPASSCAITTGRRWPTSYLEG